MPSERLVTQENFQLLLNWLDADDDTAGEEYERIRRQLVRFFVCRGCSEPETLADQTIDRVTLKAPEITADFVGNPALYFYGVANKIHFEWLRRKNRERKASFMEIDTDGFQNEAEYSCLELCLVELPSHDREMILEYYRDAKRAKIDCRKNLARKMGITIGALHIKASRIRARLKACVVKCASQHDRF